MQSDAHELRAKRASTGFIGAAIQLMRPEQWVKSAFVVIPLFFSGRVDAGVVVQVLLGAVAFALLSSATYIVNDLCDIEADKQHAKKKFRPLPSGRIGTGAAAALGLLLFASSIAIVVLAGLPARIYLIGAIYVAVNLAYSLGLKNMPVLELLMVSSGYVLRLLAGSVIDGEALSSWIIVTTGLVSLMLVVGKRRADIATIDQIGGRLSLKHYSVAYLDQLITMLAGATFVTYLLFCLSDYAAHRFGMDVTVTAVFVLFGIFRFLQIVSLETGGDSPTDMVLRDAPLRACILLWLAAFFIIIYVAR
jgi:4-hydroxybenzoate polyprenyltransferase